MRLLNEEEARAELRRKPEKVPSYSFWAKLFEEIAVLPLGAGVIYTEEELPRSKAMQFNKTVQTRREYTGRHYILRKHPEGHLIVRDQ